jgi:hypothetical protein
MTQDPSSRLPPADEKVGSLPLGARFFDLTERYIYVAVATLLLLAAVVGQGPANRTTGPLPCRPDSEVGDFSAGKQRGSLMLHRSGNPFVQSQH